MFCFRECEINTMILFYFIFVFVDDITEQNEMQNDDKYVID